jgi:excinuclease ABC subunit C
VVFEDGLARKSEYRRFVVRGAGVDDTAAMDEVLTRRFQRYLEERDQASDVELGPDPEAGPERIDPDTGKPKKFAYPPNLVVVDGGLPQVNAAQAALGALGIDDVAVVGLAKRLEEVWVPGQDYPVILPRTSEGLYLLQRVRDEAHRFAITFHRQRRSKAMTASALDSIPGLGETRRKALLRHFGSVKKVRAASAEELQAVSGIGPALAATIAAQLSSEAPAAPAVNLMTGEIIDEDGAGP